MEAVIQLVFGRTSGEALEIGRHPHQTRLGVHEEPRPAQLLEQLRPVSEFGPELGACHGSLWCLVGRAAASRRSSGPYGCRRSCYRPWA